MSMLIEQIQWFSRVWTIQEVALARTAEVASGERLMNYDSFLSGLLGWLRVSSIKSPMGEPILEANPLLDLLQIRYDVRKLVQIK